MTSVSAENIFGAERSPNGSALSMYAVPLHSTASSCWSDGWTGTVLYASFKSSGARRHPLPSDRAKTTAWSTEA